MKREIYLDNAATTKPSPDIKALFAEYAENGWYNPSALYEPSAKVSKAMDDARKTVLNALNAYSGNVIFTSGGTESNNLAIHHAAASVKRGHFITSAYEHPAVFKVFKTLEQAGHDVSYIKPNTHGVIDANEVAEAVRDDTTLISVMHVNNETGALNDISAIAQTIKSKNSAALFHSDGVQAFLKTAFTMSENIDFYSVSAHKIGGLKGTGALYLKQSKGFKPMMVGGAQEKSARPGTENTFGIMAFENAIKGFESDTAFITNLRTRLIKGLGAIADTYVNSPEKMGCFSPYIVNLSILGVKSETLLHALEADGIYIGIGSACSSKTRTSRIHDALGLDAERAESAVRISFGAENTLEDVDMLLDAIEKHAKILRQFKRR